MNLSLKDYQKLVHPGDHLALLYENESEVIEPITSYICGCVERGERCIYIYGDTDVEALIKSLKAELNYEELLEKKQIMMLKKSDAYSKDGEFVPDKMIALLQILVKQAVDDGYSGMGITGEISWVLDYDDGIDRIYEYEWKLNDRVFNEYNLSAVCRYNTSKFSDEAIKNIIQLHPIIYYKNQIHENPYYLPPVAYENDQINKYQVKTWLKNIEDYTNTKSAFNTQVMEMQEETVNNNLEEREKIFEEYHIAINKSLESKLGLQSSVVVDLAKRRVIESRVYGDEVNFKNQPYQAVYDYYYNQIIGEVDRVFFETTYSLENLMNAYYKGESINVRFNFRIGGKAHLMEAFAEFRQSPFTKNPIAFIYFYNITYKNATEKMLDVLMQKQNDLIIKNNRKYGRVIIYSKKNNDFGTPPGFMTLDIHEFRKLYQRVSDEIIVDDGGRFISDLHSFENLEVGDSFIDTFEISADGKPAYKQVLSYRTDEDTIFNIVYDVSEIVQKEKEVNEILQKALVAKEEANQAKSDFLARMSHDMRTPLAAIIGLSDFGIEEAENVELNDYFRKIKDSSTYMLNLVNDILDMQKIEENRMEITQAINISDEMFEPVLNMVQPAAEKKNINIVFESLKNHIPKYLVFDSKRVRQVLVNILSNAVKYSENDSDVIWRSEYLERDGKSYFKETFIDYGVGMSKSFQKKMFEPFSTEENIMSTSEHGTGLGLAITRNLVELMGGSIKCDSILGKGTRITIEIPMEKADEEAYNLQQNKRNKKVVKYDYTGKKILLCDDTRLNAEILKKILETKNIETDIAINGKQGVEMALENNYDMIIMDIRMPVMDGLQASSVIRANGIKIPIIAVSANAYEEDIRKSLDAGMNKHLSKPVDKEVLFKIISDYLD